MSLNTFMRLDMAALTALSIFPKNIEELKKGPKIEEKNHTLVEILDKCRTAIGSRLLKM